MSDANIPAPGAAHLDDDTLALAALGEPLDGPAEAHLAGCASCATEVSGLREVVAAAKAPAPEPAEPPAEVWPAIASRITTAAPDDRTAAQPTNIAAARSRRRTLPLALAGAAAVGALLGGSVVAALVHSPISTEVVATAALTPITDGPSGPQQGSAAVTHTGSGDALALNTRDLAPPRGFYEVWLLDPRTGGMIAMGTVPPGSAEVVLPVPPGVDLGRFNTVDISDEPFDGNPDHSAVSVLRGGLQA